MTVSQTYRPTSHEAFQHGTLLSLAYDWERVADPGVPPRWPFRVYLPRDTDDVVRAVREARDRGERLIVRGHGHSSNNLVTGEGATVLLTDRMNEIINVDERQAFCTMQGGAVLADVDAHLARRGWGLSIIGDHDHITAGGFASVGGISPASHRYGLFVDTVTELEYVDWDGEAHICGRERDPDRFHRVLAGTGRHGMITWLTVAIVRVDKHRTVLKNDRLLTTNLDDYIRRSGELIRDPGDALMERGVWADFPTPAGPLRLGQFSSYHETPQNPLKSLLNNVAYGYQRFLGYWAGRLPSVVDEIVKYLGMATIMLSPAYASGKNIERFTDQVLDSTVGDPTRMLVALAPAERYESLFRQLYEAAVEERRASGGITFISVYVKAIRSAYLSRGDETKRHCELMLYVGVNPEQMTEKILERLVDRVDDIVIDHGGFRYMHSRTSSDPERRRLLDPNARYAEHATEPVPGKPRKG
ncbi:FAD-binding oxidoreductase [Streptosporangium sp. NBC_01755]|uniref:FAD-binding oxidoreductase n=1 Tax=unclassified Streptosporangium TaxID=2632669 RepID=UPI002DDAB784|nr:MULTISPECIES: FAD-binding oxidoreductase [unclassified Streptosporangium]WSA27295.1 FAD-binding oxidoreductase [Streptosporangium sp. NBC_01810]WSD01153.1 FAD-binding oxidoreductase [Streptosporangium sp. NBC_01755]